MIELKTRWSDKIGDVPFNEYPRPQMERDSFFNLNGKWEYKIEKSGVLPDSFDDEILVPFSPESFLSGVRKTVMPDDFLWYRRKFSLPDGFNKGRVFLHFGAVDQHSTVFLNGKLLGENEGGYYPFSFEITDIVSDENELTVKVVDLSDSSYHDFGKQRLQRGGIWYTPQSGIWQTVWIESTPKEYIKGFRLTPDLENCSLEIALDKCGRGDVEITASFDGRDIVSLSSSEDTVTLTLPEIHPWSPETPDLYGLSLKFNEDEIKSYFAMRSVKIERDKTGKNRIFLNGRPYFMHGVLDQGYWSDGLYTPACEEAFEYDIRLCKSLGFNTLRKHIKVEPLRWYYLCDKIGMLVFQDMVSGGEKYSWFFTVANQFFWRRFSDGKIGNKRFGRRNEKGKEEYYVNLQRMIEHLYNVPSIVMWTTFNEGWGQFDAKAAYEFTKKLDKTRLVDHASGWHDQGMGDFKSTHIYFRPVRLRNDLSKYKRPYFLSEYGGYTLKVDGHSFNPDVVFGYKTMENREMLNDQVYALMERDVVSNIKKGLCADVYTQLSDVEDETNGLTTYDREVNKFDPCRLSQIAESIKREYEKL